MELSTAIQLIEKGVDIDGHAQIWADLGAGKGLFTRALATILEPGSSIYAIDKDSRALNAIRLNDASISLHTIETDFVKDDISLSDLDGILMANSLHFVSDKISFMKRIKKLLKTSARIILVEYDMDKSNPWVPYPISFSSLQSELNNFGFLRLEKLGEVPSAFNRSNIYSAVLY